MIKNQIKAGKKMVIEELLEKLVKEGGSDLHISSDLPPAIRIDGKLTRVDMEPL